MKTTKKYIAKINRILELKTLFFIIFLVLGNSQLSFPQNKITSVDERKIKQKASGIISDLANKYNQLLEADTEDRNRMIDIMTVAGMDNISVFESDQIIIEDDFITRINSSIDIPTKRVDIYFNDICRNYGKKDNGEYMNEGKLVTIRNIIPSKVLAISPQSPMFIKIFFEVIYEGIDDRTKLPFKQPAYRVAEFIISKPKNIFSVAINTIRFSKGEQENDKNLEKNVTIIPVEWKVVLEDLNIEEKKTVFRNPLLQAYKSDGKWGIANLDDNDKILVKPTFDYIDDFTEDGLALVNIEGLWGYVDLEGKIVIKCEYDNADPFSKDKKGRARVTKGLENYLIDKNGLKTK